MHQYPKHQPDRIDHLTALAQQAAGFTTPQARETLAWNASDRALAAYLHAVGFESFKAAGGIRTLRWSLPAIVPTKAEAQADNVALRRIVPADPSVRQRLRPTVSMASGPNVLREPGRWGSFFARQDRERYGNTGPARSGLNWTHLAAALIGAAIMLAIAGAR